MSDNGLRSFQISSMTNHLSERMGRLCRTVLQRLPHDWDEFRTVDFQESNERPAPSTNTIGYASAIRHEESESLPSELPSGVDAEQCWSVTLYVEHLEQISDKAILYVIAHELGHVAAGLRSGSIVIGGIPMTQRAPGIYVSAHSKDHQENAADMMVMTWGFTAELQQFLAETA